MENSERFCLYFLFKVIRNYLVYLNYSIAVVEKGNDKEKAKELFN